MDLQSIARLGQANKALAELMQHCLMDAPKDELQKVNEQNRKLIQIVCHMTSAFGRIFQAFVKDDNREHGSFETPWPFYEARHMVSAMNEMYDLETLNAVLRPMTDTEVERFLEGEGDFIITPEDNVKIVEHLLQRI